MATSLTTTAFGTTSPTKPSIAPSPARLSLAATGSFLALLALLHVLKPEIDPSWRFISEYASGDYGWVMTLAFLALAVSSAALFVALRRDARGIAGRVGLGLLLISAIGPVLAAMFPMDPITARPEGTTASGALHNVGGALGSFGLVAVLLLSWSVWRSPAWANVRRPVLCAAGAALVGFVVSAAWIGGLVAQSGGTFGPDVPVGWPNRFGAVMACVWPVVVARHVAGRSAAHCSFYPMSVAVMEAHRAELERYDTSKGTIRFASDEPLPAAGVSRRSMSHLFSQVWPTTCSAANGSSATSRSASAAVDVSNVMRPPERSANGPPW